MEVAGVGPITAPQKTVRGHLDEALCNRLDVRIRRPEPRDAIGTSQLDPYMPVSGQVQQRPDGRLVHPQAGVDAAEVVNHHRRWDVGDPWPQVGQRRASKVKFDEPAEAVDAPHDVIENFQIQFAAMLRIECEANATRARLMQCLASCGGGAGIESHHGQVTAC